MALQLPGIKCYYFAPVIIIYLSIVVFLYLRLVPATLELRFCFGFIWKSAPRSKHLLDKKRALSNITYTTCSTLKSIHNISWLGGKQSGGQGGGTISEQASEWLVDCNSLNGCSKNTDKPLKSQWSPLADSAVCVGNKTERETRKRQNQR